MIRLLIVEGHAVCADGLAALLGSQGDIALLGIARDEAQANERITAATPDVVLCDVMLGGCDRGFALLRAHGRRTRFLMLSLLDYPAHHVRAVREGAAGFVTSSMDTDAIAGAIRRAAAGGTAFPPEVMANLRVAPREPTDRERELLAMLARGATNEELADRMHLRVKSVEGMLRRLFDRYGVENRTELAWYALAQGWLTGAPMRVGERARGRGQGPGAVAVGGRA
jgi:DNA-binding NarL/FixJ family response regulator